MARSGGCWNTRLSGPDPTPSMPSFVQARARMSDDPAMRVAFIGLGIMGSRMAVTSRGPGTS